jgi:tetratricopeptide (TPR) repeat protein
VSEDLLSALANRTNQAILNLLAVEPTYPRRIGELLALGETEVARRLKHMEGLGIVAGAWAHVHGKNVRLYKLIARDVGLRFTPEGLRVEVAGQDGRGRASLLTPLTIRLPSPGPFVGRADELGVLEGPASVVIVEGMPGIGKTSLLARFAEAQPGKRAVFWHSFRGPETLGWLANRLGVFFAQHGERALLDAVEAGAEAPDKLELMLRGMDDARFLVVFDDAHRVEDEAVKAFLGDAIARTRSGKLLLGSRERPRYDVGAKHVHLLRLSGLKDEDVARFLAGQGVAVDAQLLPRIREEVGGHPLALNLLVETAQAQGVGLEALLDRIPEKNVEEWLLQEVVGQLRDDERELLAAASVFRGRFDLDDLAELTRKSPEAALLRLRRRVLVQASEGGEFALHEVVRNFFYNLQRHKRELHEKAAVHELGKGSVEGHLEAMHHFLAAGRRDRVLDLLQRNLDLHEFDFIDAGYHNLYLQVLEGFRREDVPEERRWALIEDEKGDIRLHRAEPERALEHYGRAEAVFRKLKEHDRLADLAWKKGLALQRLGREKEAQASVRAGLAGQPDARTRERLDALAAQLRGRGGAASKPRRRAPPG